MARVRSTVQEGGGAGTLERSAGGATLARGFHGLAATWPGEEGREGTSTVTFLPFLNESRLNISGQEGELES